MSEKILKSRIIHKHAIEADWLKATNFIPKQGEIIVYDIDTNYDYERMKIGDGKTVVSSLPFIESSKAEIADKAIEADHAISADTATKADTATTADSATKDANGNIITDTYATKTELDEVSALVGDTAVATQISNAMSTKADKANGVYTVTTEGDGSAYTATVPSVTELTVGASFIMVPNVTSTTTTPTLNVNGLGAKDIKRRLSNLSTSLQAGYTDTWLAKDRPFRVIYDGTAWIVEGHTKPTAADMYGTLGVEKGGTGATTAADARENLEVYSKADHEWVQIYDSGEITASVNAFANIDITGYRKLMVAIKCVNNNNNLTTKQGTATFVSENGTVYQFPVWSSMFAASTDITGGMGWFDIMDGWIICSNASRNLKATNFLNTQEGGTADNLAGIGGGMMKCTSPLLTMMISALDQDVDYHFDAGSRVIVWGGNA